MDGVVKEVNREGLTKNIHPFMNYNFCVRQRLSLISGEERLWDLSQLLFADNTALVAHSEKA